MSKKPSVVIVGRMNVGKSTLFNRLSDSVKSLTLDYAGVTRDFIKETICWDNRCFELVDTGGISLRKSNDPLMEKTREVALAQLESASSVIFLVDGSIGITQEDREIAKLLHKLDKKVIVAVNKMDRKESIEQIHEFDRFGFATVLPISAEHSRGIGDLLTEITNTLPDQGVYEEEKTGCKVVLLGKPNVGKSSLLNLLVHEERAIVSEIPGTTREAISEKISFYQEDILVTDTPGIRKKRAVNEEIETMMVKSSMRALDKADVVLLLVDASAGRISDQELKLAFYAFTQRYKGLVLLFNKQDLVTSELKETLSHSLEEYEYVLARIPQMNISCKNEKNIGRVLPLVKEVCDRFYMEIPEHDLTTLFKNELQKKPLYHKTMALMVYGAQQVKKGPMTIALRVNEPKWFEQSQLTFFENLMRRNYNLKGVPVKFMLRKGK